MTNRNRHPARSACRLALAITAVAVPAGCTSSTDGINAPLPRSGRAQAMTKASATAHAIAAAGGHRAGKPTSGTDVSDCVGTHDEVASDGRFVLQYTVNIDAPPAQHNGIGRQIRASMKKAKYSDITWGPARSKNDEMTLRGYTGDWSAEVGSTVGNHGPGSLIYIGVTTPCLLPPGAKQQKS